MGHSSGSRWASRSDRILGSDGGGAAWFRRPLDYVWVCLAIAGILLFTPLADSSFDTTGVLLAVLAGAGFGGTLIFLSKFGHSVGGVTAAGMALGAGGIALAPISVGTGLAGAIEPGVFAADGGRGVLMSVFGNAIETTALTRVKPSLYAVLISTEPAVGAILGFIILQETSAGWAWRVSAPLPRPRSAPAGQTG